MIKFFRKHNKQLLAILTVFLMIAFLGGTALSNFLKSRRGAQTIAHAFGKSLTQQQRDAVFNQCHILEQMQSQGGFFFVWSMPWLSQSQQYAGYDVRRLDPISYLILIQEAKEKGYQPDLTAARAALSEKDRDLTAFRLQNKISIQNMEAAVANFLMVQRLWQDVENGVQVSEMEVEQAARDQMETVNAELVAIHSKPLVDQTTLVSEEALQQQFEKYKDRKSNGQPLDFGYVIPDRVQVEYLKIDMAKIQPRKVITDKMVEDYYRGHASEFPDFKTLDDSTRAAVLDKMKKNAAQEEARTMTDTIHRRLADPWVAQKSGDDGYPLPPAGVESSDYYHQAVERFRSELSHPDSIEFGQTDLFTRAQAQEQPEIGKTAEYTSGDSGERRFADLIHLVQGLVDRSKLGDDQRRISELCLALYQTASWTLVDGQKNLYLYRVIKVEPEHAPAQLADVLDQVKADVQAQQAFEKAKLAAKQVQTLAESNGLQKAWEDYSELTPEQKSEAGTYFKTKPFAKLGQELAPGFRMPVVVEDSKDSTGKSDSAIRSEEFVTDVYRLLSERGDHALGIVEVPTLETVFVVKLDGVNLLDRKKYDLSKAHLADLLRQSRISAIRREWFDPNRIRNRAGFESVGQKGPVARTDYDY